MDEHTHKSTDTVFNCVIPYIHNGDDRNSISLVCHNWYEIDRLTRKHVTIHMVYSHQPSRVAQRFPYLESLTLKGLPGVFINIECIDIALWIKEIVHSFKCLKSLDIRRLILSDADLEQIARGRGKDLRVLKINKCKGFKGFIHIGRHCNDLRTLCLEDNDQRILCWDEKDIKEIQDNRKWLHELALNNTRIELFKFSSTTSGYDVKDLTLLAKSCSQSLVSLSMGKCRLSDLRDVFSHAVNLKDFVCCEHEHFEQEGDHVGLELPQNMCISINKIEHSVLPIVLPLSDQIRELNISHLQEDSQCFLIQRCPNLEALYIKYVYGDNVLKVMGRSCKKLRKFKTGGLTAIHVGLIALAQGCLKLECLHIQSSEHISNESLECIGPCLKNLNDFQVTFYNSIGRRISVLETLDSGIRSMLIGCSKLERLSINRQLTHKILFNIGKYGHNLKHLSLDFMTSSNAGLVDSGIQAMLIGCSKLESLRLNNCCGDLTNVGLGYIGKYGRNLRHLSLSGYIGYFKEGLIELSEGCPRLRKLEIDDHFFSKEELSTLMFRFQSLRYMWVLDRAGSILWAKTRYKWVTDCNSERTLLEKTGRY